MPITPSIAWTGTRQPPTASGPAREWEYAARGTDGRKYPWGSTAPESQLCWNRTSKEGTCAVGSYPAGASPFGLLDMAGNVWEWTSSRYCPYPSKNCDTPTRVFRGESWSCSGAWHARSANRGMNDPESRYTFIGFRCAR
jgi:formylglycine-generating enzyme required for sulfatase activity